MKLARTLLVLLVACAPARSATTTARGDVLVLGPAGEHERLADLVTRAPATVLLFVSSTCPVQRAHEARIRALYDAFAPRGVAFFAVASEVDDVDVAEERARLFARGLPLPVVGDRGAKLADALGVEFSTHTLVFDRAGRLVYTGAFDGDRSHLSDDARAFAREAIAAALAGTSYPPPPGSAEPLGCPLRKH